jgi:poly-D-alanine transfer protein DltD
MRAEYSNAVNEALKNAPTAFRKVLSGQVSLLVQDFHHPSLYAKKYDESKDRYPRGSTGTGGSASGL